MDLELQYLVHFYNDENYLFKTITIAEASQMGAICDAISAQRGWFWPTFAASERQDYLQRRLFVEKAMYSDYTQVYGRSKELAPGFFYLYPKITEQQALELARQRTGHDEAKPHVLMVKIQDLETTENITFTLHDSHAAYRQRTIAAGIKCRGDGDGPVVRPDHNRVFPFSMLEQMHRKYRAQQIRYEIQVWDYQLLERLRYKILAIKSKGDSHGYDERPQQVDHRRVPGQCRQSWRPVCREDAAPSAYDWRQERARARQSRRLCQ